MTDPRKAVQVSVYLNEADEWHHRPLHLEMLRYLREQEVAGATVLHAVAGFTGHSRVKTSTLVDAGGKLPLVLTFIDVEEHVNRVLPHIKEMAPHRLVVSENVIIEAGDLA
jgi:PII-like signaling protein